MAYISNPISSLADIKELLNIDVSDTSKDDMLNSFINACTLGIENYCDRKFTRQNFFEFINARNFSIQLKNTPINVIKFSAYDIIPSLKIQNSTGVPVTFEVQYDRIKYTPSDTLVTEELLFSGSPRISRIADWINTNLYYLSATVLKEAASYTLYNGSYTLNDSETYDFCSFANASKLDKISEGYYAVDNEYPHFIVYDGGYDTFPADLVTCCNQMVIFAYQNSSEDPLLNGETIGNYSWTRKDIGGTGTIADPLSMLSTTYLDILQNYKNICL
jgi:hypothetical protein